MGKTPFKPPRSDSNGIFRFQELTAGEDQMLVEKHGYRALCLLRHSVLQFREDSLFDSRQFNLYILALILVSNNMMNG